MTLSIAKLSIQRKKTSEFGPWLHRYGFFVSDDNLIEHPMRQPVALFLSRPLPTFGGIGEKFGQSRKMRIVAMFFRIQGREFAFERFTLGSVLAL